MLDTNGQFKFLSLPDGDYSITPAVKGYSFPNDQNELQTSIQRDVDNFVISLSPKQTAP